MLAIIILHGFCRVPCRTRRRTRFCPRFRRELRQLGTVFKFWGKGPAVYRERRGVRDGDDGGRVLGRVFKCSSFHGKRRRVMSRVLGKESILTVVPAKTKGSLYCRIPTLLVSKVAVMMSPLVSLVVSRIGTLGRTKIRTTCVGDTLARQRVAGTLRLTTTNECGVVCITPRHLLAPQFLSFTYRARLSVIAVSRTRYVSR